MMGNATKARLSVFSLKHQPSKESNRAWKTWEDKWKTETLSSVKRSSMARVIGKENGGAVGSVSP